MQCVVPSNRILVVDSERPPDFASHAGYHRTGQWPRADAWCVGLTFDLGNPGRPTTIKPGFPASLSVMPTPTPEGISDLLAVPAFVISIMAR
jgi:hypothetical protein